MAEVDFTKTYPIRLGKSFTTSSSQFWTVKYLFKPEGIDDSREASMKVEGTECLLTIPKVGDSEVVMKGNVKEPKTVETLLIFDPQTESFVLEKHSKDLAVHIHKTNVRTFQLAEEHPHPSDSDGELPKPATLPQASSSPLKTAAPKGLKGIEAKKRKGVGVEPAPKHKKPRKDKRVPVPPSPLILNGRKEPATVLSESSSEGSSSEDELPPVSKALLSSSSSSSAPPARPKPSSSGSSSSSSSSSGSSSESGSASESESEGERKAAAKKGREEAAPRRMGLKGYSLSKASQNASQGHKSLFGAESGSSDSDSS